MQSSVLLVEGVRQGLDRAKEVAGQVIRLAEAQVRHPPDQLAEECLQLHLGQERAHTEVRATTTEPDVWVRAPTDVEGVGVGDYPLVAIARRVHQQHPVAFSD